MRIETGKGQISLIVLVAIWSVSAVVSLPGLAISPILGDLSEIFKSATELDIQMLTSLPSSSPLRRTRVRLQRFGRLAPRLAQFSSCGARA